MGYRGLDHLPSPWNLAYTVGLPQLLLPVVLLVVVVDDVLGVVAACEVVLAG